MQPTTSQRAFWQISAGNRFSRGWSWAEFDVKGMFLTLFISKTVQSQPFNRLKQYNYCIRKVTTSCALWTSSFNFKMYPRKAPQVNNKLVHKWLVIVHRVWVKIPLQRANIQYTYLRFHTSIHFIIRLMEIV